MPFLASHKFLELAPKLHRLQAAASGQAERFETTAMLGTRNTTTARTAERNRMSAYARGRAAHALQLLYILLLALTH